MLVFHCVASFYSGLTPPAYFFWRACTLKVREELTGTKSDLQVKGVCVILLVVSLCLASPLLPKAAFLSTPPPHPVPSLKAVKLPYMLWSDYVRAARQFPPDKTRSISAVYTQTKPPSHIPLLTTPTRLPSPYAAFFRHSQRAAEYGNILVSELSEANVTIEKRTSERDQAREELQSMQVRVANAEGTQCNAK